jgi:hypothetical protein
MRSSTITKQLVVAIALIGLSAFGNEASAVTIMSTTTLMGQITSMGTGPKANYGQQYNGEYTITASYTINTIMQGGMLVVDPTTSFVTFTDTSKKYGPFDTLKIPITDATGDLEGGDITGFSFMATDWYKNLPAYLTQNGINGNVVIVGSDTSTITASYKYIPPRNNDPTKITVLDYTFVSPSPAPAPAPGNFDPFPGVPEPASWAIFLAGFGALGCMMRGMRRREVGAVA